MFRYDHRPRRSRMVSWSPLAAASAALLVAALSSGALAGDDRRSAHRWDNEWDDVFLHDWEQIGADTDGDNGDETPFSEAVVLAELNDTDGDLGFHASIDGDAWRLLEIEDPNGRVVLRIRGRSPLRLQGLTQLFFESAEPTFDELTPEEFFARFPEGDYEVSGISTDGRELESVAQFTHLLAAPADGVAVSGVPVDPDLVDCDEGPRPLVNEPVVIRWDPITESHPEIGRTGEPVEIAKYQLVVERLEPTLLIYSVDLPPTLTALELPTDFTALGEVFKLEILAREISGNQTAIETCFEIRNQAP
ncbi:MAG: hypothetical protein HKM95_15180 [Inquilinus sp.]|nr:hypothetical protein [Inquilinus sp.]